MEDHQEISMPFFHEHPLRWLPNVIGEIGWRNYCSGCGRFFLPGEAAYVCSVNCGYQLCLHEECAEMPREIRHPLHPSHQLTLTKSSTLSRDQIGQCVVCDDPIEYGLIYICSEGCEKLWFHLRCVGDMEVTPDEQLITHPSHPQHQLRFLRSCTFKCDACGTTEKGNSYVCTICQYWIHERCAALPTAALFDHHPTHPLSLTFYLPYEYNKYNYTCCICNGALRLRHWVYHCACRYVVHVDCANKISSAATFNTINNEDTNIGKYISKAPMDDLYEEIIKPFVEKQIGETSISHRANTAHYMFHRQDHPLSFTPFLSSSSFRDDNEEESESDGDDDDDGSELRCNGCTIPINKKSKDGGYMSCGECKYFLHLACFNLPPYLTCHRLHQIEGHELILQSPFDNFLDTRNCSICFSKTNGLVYACTKCTFKLDIKCASMPETVKHAAHPQPHHYLNLVTHRHLRSFCVACYSNIDETALYYKCNNCRFSVCRHCIFLPARNRHRLEKHMLPLTYDASANHPGEFYCNNCEQKMHPRRWMYHCIECDQSFHPGCFPATSGFYRNINFGRQLYHVRHHPHHSFRFQIITKKKYCNVCHGETYDLRGFQCTSCNFDMCYSKCYNGDVVQAVN